MEININSSKKREIEAYKRIVNIFHSYFPANIKKINLNIEIEKSVFVCYIEYGERREGKRIRDISDIEEKEEGETILKVREERYAPILLSYLLDKFGREKIEQRKRLEIIVNEKVKRIKDVVLEETEEYSENLWSFLNYIIPEGFRIWYGKRRGNSMLIIASEDAIEENTIKEFKKEFDL